MADGQGIETFKPEEFEVFRPDEFETSASNDPGVIREPTMQEQVAQGFDRAADFLPPGIDIAAKAPAAIVRDPKGSAATVTEVVGAGIGAVGGTMVVPGLDPTDLVLTPLSAAIGEEGARQFNEMVGLRPETDATEAFGRVATSFLIDLVFAGTGRFLETGQGFKRSAAKRAGSRAQELGKPASKSGAVKVLYDDIAKADDFIKDSNLYNGGTQYDVVTGRFKGPKRTADKKPPLETIVSNIDEALPSIQSQKKVVNEALDSAALRYNDALPLNSPKRITGVTFNELQDAMSGLLEYRNRLLKNPSITGDEAQVITESLQGVAQDIGSTMGALGRGGELSVSQLDDTLANLYVGLRNARQFERAVRAGAAAGKQIPKSIDDSIRFLKEASGAVRELRDKKVEGILSVLGGKDKTLKGLKKDSVQRLQDATHFLLNERDLLEESIGAGVEAGARATTAMLVPEMARTGLSSKTNTLERAANRAILEPLGFGPATLTDRLSRTRLKRVQKNLARSQMEPGAIETVGRFLQEPGGMAAITAGKNLLSAEEASASTINQRILERGQAQGFLAEPKETQALPREVDDLFERKEDFLPLVLEAVGNPSVAMELERIEANGTKMQLAQALAAVVEQLPSLRDYFEPPKTGFLSEFRVGKRRFMFSEIDRVGYKDEIDLMPDLDSKQKSQMKAALINQNEVISTPPKHKAGSIAARKQTVLEEDQ